MKKIIALFCIVILSFLLAFSTACNKQMDLTPYVSELRQTLYYGESQNYKVKAHYGFKENPYMADGEITEKHFALCFTLLDIYTDSAEYTVSFTYNNTPYQSAFRFFSPKDVLMAVVPVSDFNENSLSISITKGDKKENITLNSINPAGTISYQDALSYLVENQKGLVDKYCDKNGNFIGEIHIRLIVKNQKSYWYIGLTNDPKNLKALLIDGFSGDVLAIREID